MVDQRFLPRIHEGEARFVMIGRALFRVEHYVYIGGVGGETKTTIYTPGQEGCPYTDIQKKFESEIDDYLKALGLPLSALPLLWAADFIPVDNHKSPMVIGEFNCSCLGLAGFLNARGKSIGDLSAEDAATGQAMANVIGGKCLESLDAFYKKSQVEHIVLTAIREDATDAEKEAMFQEMYKLRTIDGVLNLTSGQTTTPQRSQGYTRAFRVRFRDQAALDAYVVHPLHVKFFEEFTKPMMDRKVPPVFFDFIVDEAGKL